MALRLVGPAGAKLSPWTNGCRPHQRERRLKWFDELPKVLQYNKYVRSGYRAGGQLLAQAIATTLHMMLLFVKV